MLHQNRKFLGALCALLCCLLFQPLGHADNGMGMTWKKQSHHDILGVDRVGCSGCDAYQGDTSCSTKLPILCLKQDNSPDPGVPILPCTGCVMPDDFYSGWAEGHIGLTLPVRGDALMGVADANDICQFFVGSDYRIGEHHDGKRQSGGYGGWNWYAYGNVNDSSRFWAHINGQPSNCWGNGAGVHSERTDADILALVSPDIRLVNISTRAVIQGGHEDVIAGFIIKGTGKQMVLIRALGEGLGLSPGVDARLTLTTLSGDLISTNEESGNWVPPSIWNEQSWASMPIILDNWQPPHVSDAALLLDLPAGLYTAIMSSSGAKGIGLVEANAIPLKKIRTLPFYMILRYLNEARPEIQKNIKNLKTRFEEKDKITIISEKKQNDQSHTPFDDVISESLMLALPVLPVLGSLNCNDSSNTCPLAPINELFTVNSEGQSIPISGTDYQGFLKQYTGYLENIDEVFVIEDDEVPDINQPFTLSDSVLSSEAQKAVNIDLPKSGQFKLSDGSNPPVTVERIRVLPFPAKTRSFIIHYRYNYGTFYVWWQ